ncbi:MAG: DNA helicase RecG [Phototrophicales bacterium]|nr:MAG: DNA helicase RecG [Phototrophicales bacterium]
MPSSLEKLIQVLRREEELGYKNTAVQGGLSAYAIRWRQEAIREAKTEHQRALVEELTLAIEYYQTQEERFERQQVLKYMLGRITQRVEPRPEFLAATETIFDDALDEDDISEEPISPPSKQEPIQKTKPIKKQADLTAVGLSIEPIPMQAAQSRKPKPRRQSRPSLNLEEQRRRLAALELPVTKLKGVGTNRAEQLARLGINTIGDLLFHWPRRYDDYTRMPILRRLTPDQQVTVIGTIRSVQELYSRQNTKYIKVVIDDTSGKLELIFFNMPFLKRMLKVGMQIAVAGKTDLFRGQICMVNPEWELIDQQNLVKGSIVPVYPLTEGLSNKFMRKIMRQAIDDWADKIVDYMPESVLERAEMVDLEWAIRQLHFPEHIDYIDYAHERLAFDELILLQLGILAKRREWQSQPSIPLQVEDEWWQQCIDSLPYSLTGAQERALSIIREDMSRDLPMNRLLQGDVGSGKTVVAALSMAIAVANGTQAAIMAPTGVLAEQHYKSISNFFQNLPNGDTVDIRLLTGATTGSTREEIYRGLSDGSIQVVVGTHALIQEGVEFANLSLAIIDEQHRFGVEERGALRGKGTNPHVLIMTATPIPRTLALTIFADLDVTVLDEMPAGRTPVVTKLLLPSERERAYSFIRSQVDKGRQAFMIYPLIESSEKLEATSAIEAYEELSQTVFHGYRVGLLHGRMSPNEKDAIMTAFSQHELDILISTTVIEVGIDVPNASVILIDGADRFGLAQLHQLRGRVGRGPHESYCLLVSDTQKEDALERLAKLETINDGFTLAELDWKLRGAGDLLGTRQAGFAAMRMGSIINEHLVELAQFESRALFAEDPYLNHTEHVLLAERIEQLRRRRTDIS